MNDLIYRQNAIEGVKELFACADIGNDECDITYMLENLPSADRPPGEWVEKDGECVCSECGNSVSFSWTEDGWVLGKFCQTCGAKMKGGVE